MKTVFALVVIFTFDNVPQLPPSTFYFESKEKCQVAGAEIKNQDEAQLQAIVEEYIKLSAQKVKGAKEKARKTLMKETRLNGTMLPRVGRYWCVGPILR